MTKRLNVEYLPDIKWISFSAYKNNNNKTNTPKQQQQQKLAKKTTTKNNNRQSSSCSELGYGYTLLEIDVFKIITITETPWSNNL